MCNQILVLNRVDAEEFESSFSWACISIANAEEEFATIPDDNRLALFQLAFIDQTQPYPGFALFNDEHAYEIFDFVSNYWDEIDTLLIHCDAGISRSSAVAAVLSRFKFGSEGEFLYPPYDPNPRVYRILREVACGREDFCECQNEEIEENDEDGWIEEDDWD
ncbi:Hypothetical protein PBC10988_29080 [Planctomycetales bacterium 10988]|nr:Hypothetical protein PBC10988_29080 [Planctomycetales bacterium 10988]